MLIVVDEDIPFAAQAFARFGEVRALPARELNAATIRDADALIVRSVTRVDAGLLDGSRIGFVGTATSGVDHIDLGYLRDRGIAFADACGANANAVVEYVVAALLHFHERRGLRLSGASLGIIGFGHVGRRVARFAAALGLRIVVNDPPLGRSTCEPFFRPLDEILACDVVTLHVPLERAGLDPTYHLVNDAFIDAMKPGSILINTSRGAVADTESLKRAALAKRLGGLVLDVWENEPAIDMELMKLCQIATAHIAGHTLDAKRAAVQRLADAFTTRCGFDRADIASEQETRHELMCKSVADAVRGAFDIADADRRLRETLDLATTERAATFDALRAGWPTRREFHVRPIAFEEGAGTDMETLRALGFCAAALAEGVPR